MKHLFHTAATTDDRLIFQNAEQPKEAWSTDDEVAAFGREKLGLDLESQQARESLQAEFVDQTLALYKQKDYMIGHSKQFEQKNLAANEEALRPAPLVKAVQLKLIALGYADAGTEDGIYGPQTRANVAAFQRENGLNDMGIIGSLTIGKLLATETFVAPAPVVVEEVAVEPTVVAEPYIDPAIDMIATEAAARQAEAAKNTVSSFVNPKEPGMPMAGERAETAESVQEKQKEKAPLIGQDLTEEDLLSEFATDAVAESKGAKQEVVSIDDFLSEDE